MKFFGYFLFFISMLIFFMPKSNIYYLLETKLKNYEFILSKEQIQDTGYSLKIKDATLSVKSIDMAKVGEIEIKTYLLYNSIGVSNIYLSSMANTFIPLKIDTLKILYTIIDPLNIHVKAFGKFGTLEAKLNIKTRKFHLELIPSKLMKQRYQNTLRKLKKTKKGVYIYEKNI